MAVTLEYISESIDNKIQQNSKRVVYTYYELICDEKLAGGYKKYFIDMAKIRLENLDYNVYLTGEEYWEDNQFKIVETNYEIIAIKKEDENSDKKSGQDIGTKHTKIKHFGRINKKIRKK